MNLPLVSRRAFDLVLEERNRLRTQVDQLLDDFTRLKRTQMGLRETPRPAKRSEPEEIPADVRGLIEGFGSKVFRDETERQVRTMRAQGTPWVEIGRVLEEQLTEGASGPGPDGYP